PRGHRLRAPRGPPGQPAQAGQPPGQALVLRLLLPLRAGLTLLKEKDGDGYLLASSQGDNSFAAYDRELGDGNEYEGGFRVIAASATLDGTEESDGAAVLNEPLGSKYPNGLLVVQDGDDKPGEPGRDATNFKFVDLERVLDALDD
ncbi:phytase, partial [Amycolatopsis lurida]|uniref:phytase n=1 Tax=Amycolatopsis lurida TaxID=31959 RepID=UPI003665039D